MISTEDKYIKKPDWLKTRLPSGKNFVDVKDIVKSHKLNTICESGNCPNIGECWGEGVATFMILGDICTRSCKFCAVKTGKPDQVDLNEPYKIAQSVLLMKLNHCVITSVDRDDLDDGGAYIWAKTIKEIKIANPNITIEALIPDFKGKEIHIMQIINEKPDVVSHNLETVKRLSQSVRIFATYKTSLNVLSHLKSHRMVTKSGLMVGLGETNEEILETMQDIANTGCDIFTIGQYLRPSFQHLPVERYVTPEEFIHYKIAGLKMGFKVVESGPLVRSSYHAEKHLSKKV